MKRITRYIPVPLAVLLVYIFLVLMTIYILKHFTFIAAPVFFSMVIAYLLNPLVNLLEKKTSIKREIISAVLMVLLVVIMLFLVITILPDVIENVKNAAEKLPDTLKQFSEKAKVLNDYLSKNFSEFVGEIDIMKNVEDLVSNILSNLADVLGQVFSSIYGIIITLLYLIFIPLFSYYFLKDYYKIKENLFGLIPKRYKESFLKKFVQLDGIFSSFIRGQAIVVVILAILYSTGLSLIGLPFALLVGIFAGLGDIIPYLGTIIGFVVSIIIGFAHFESYNSILLIVFLFLLVKGTENWYFYPKIVGKEVGLHFVWVLLTIFFAAHFFGFWGLLIAIPSAAGLQVFLKDLVDYYKKSHFFKKAK